MFHSVIGSSRSIWKGERVGGRQGARSLKRGGVRGSLGRKRQGKRTRFELSDTAVQ